jgi:hypothetical protein
VWLPANPSQERPGGGGLKFYYPYTSSNYHTLLVADPLDNYRADYEFADLRLVVGEADKIGHYW